MTFGTAGVVFLLAISGSVMAFRARRKPACKILFGILLFLAVVSFLYLLLTLLLVSAVR